MCCFPCKSAFFVGTICYFQYSFTSQIVDIRILRVISANSKRQSPFWYLISTYWCVTYSVRSTVPINCVHGDVIKWKYFPRHWPGDFPAQRPVTRSFDVFFDLRLNKWFSKQSWGWQFETLLCPLWRHCNVSAMYDLSLKVTDHNLWSATLRIVYTKSLYL